MSSALPSRGWPGQFIPPDRANRHVATGCHGPALTQRGNGVGDDFADGARLVFIDLGRSGIAAPFKFFPFHNSEIAGA